MILAGLEVTLRLFEVYSLKEKRSIVKSIVDRTKNRFNVSSAEVAEMDNLNQAVVGFAVVSNNQKITDKVLQSVVNEIDQFYEVEIISTEWFD